MSPELDVKFSRLLSLFLAVSLPLTLGWKLTLRADNPDEVNNSITGFLTKNRYNLIATNEMIDESHVLRASSGDCKLLVAKVLALRDARDQV